MPTEPSPPPVLDYLSPEERDAIPFIASMRTWRWLSSCGVWLAITGYGMGLVGFVGLSAPLVLGGMALALVAGIITLIYMTRAAANEAGIGYAVRHLLLALILLPVLFLGVFLVTRLVEADLIKWRLADRLPPAP